LFWINKHTRICYEGVTPSEGRDIFFPIGQLSANLYTIIYYAPKRHLRKQCAIPFHPVNSLADIVIPKRLQQTTRNENFVLWDYKRILMFGTAEILKLLLQYDHWFIDGTFKIAPTIFCQVFTIYALIDNSAYPLVYILLPDKSEDSYMRVFKELKSLQPKLNTASIMLDFEKAIHNACNINFPETTLVGCLFHLGQNLWRKAQEFHFATAYRNDEDLRMRVKMILALSFMPIQDVPEDFEDFRWMHRKI